MSVAQAQGIVRTRLAEEKRKVILAQMPENIQNLWKEYRSLGHPYYTSSMIEKFIIYVAALYLGVLLLLKGRKIKIREIYLDFLQHIETSNNNIKEFSKKPDIQLVIKAFKDNNVAWI